MGAIHFSIDEDLVMFLARLLPFEIFFESGTFKGDSIDRVKKHFKKIYSVEFSSYYFELSKKRFINAPHVEIIHGDAGLVLSELMNQIVGSSVLYWLDSHWCDAEKTEGATCQCSLVKEIEAINPLNDESVVLIDDARLFLSPPPSSHEYMQWPDFDELLTLLKSKSDSHAIMVLNDVIIFFPKKIKAELKLFSHQNVVDWLVIADMYRQAKSILKELDAKESEINLLVRKNKDLVEEIQSKENEIKKIFSEAERRLNIINQFEAAKEDIRSGFINEVNLLNKPLGRKMQQSLTMNTLIEKNEDLYNQTVEIAEARLHIIQEQESVVCSMRRRPFECLRIWLQPKLGLLYHYHPRPLKVPEKYYKDQKKKTPSGGWPLISIVTPSYNQAGFIERTMQSVLQQQYPKLEYLIQDGGSDDGTSNILEKYTDRLERWESLKDEGQSDALNKGFQNATGEIMAYLNSDDLLLPGALHYVAHYFAKHPEVDVVYGHRVLVDEYDREIGRWVMPPHDDDVLSWADYIPQETMFWRREIWDKAGGFIEKEFKFAMDWDLILRFREAGANMVRLPRFLGAFRIHPHQKTSSEIQEKGSEEMAHLRKRCLGRTVSATEINQNIKRYLLRHVISQKLYHAGILRH